MAERNTSITRKFLIKIRRALGLLEQVPATVELENTPQESKHDAPSIMPPGSLAIENPVSVAEPTAVPRTSDSSLKLEILAIVADHEETY